MFDNRDQLRISFSVSFDANDIRIGKNNNTLIGREPMLKVANLQDNTRASTRTSLLAGLGARRRWYQCCSKDTGTAASLWWEMESQTWRLVPQHRASLVSGRGCYFIAFS